MTRQQIVAFTAETGRRVAANEIGIAPRSEKHLRRLEELKRKAQDVEASSECAKAVA